MVLRHCAAAAALIAVRREALATFSARQLRLMFLLQPWSKSMMYGEAARSVTDTAARAQPQGRCTPQACGARSDDIPTGLIGRYCCCGGHFQLVG